jgi:6-phosphogluconolactonase
MAASQNGTNASQPRLECFAGPDALAHGVADWIAALALAKDGVFAVCLSGGETPRRLYRTLAGPVYRDIFPWAGTHWFWGDERFVPHDDARSNYGMVREILLSRAPIPAANIHPIATGNIEPEDSARAYEHELKRFYRAARLDPARPLFDVTLLGLGADGHTASLFPKAAALGERERWAMAVSGPEQDTRITLTYPVLESSRHMGFLISGQDKQAIFERLRRGDPDLPAAHMHPLGELIFFADKAALGTA